MKRILLGLLLAAAPARAQTPGAGPLVLTLPASTRALSLAGAYPIAQTESDALFYNPAYGERLRGAGLGMQRFGSQATLYSLSAATDWLGGALGFGVLALDYHTGEAAGLAIPAGAARDLFERGSAAASERSALVSYARRVFGVRVAATGKLIEQRLDSERNTTVSADLAAAHDFGVFAAGLAVQNLGPDLELHGSDVHLPLRVRADASTDAAPVGPLDVSAAASVAWTRTGEVVPAAGVEVGWWPVQGRTFFLRGGIARADEGQEPFTAGAGFSGDKLSVDYAWAPYEAGPAHRVTLRWR